MAFKFKISAKTAKLDKLIKQIKELEKPVSKSDAERLGTQVVLEMRRNIGVGISPITGQRFPKYKNKDKYPGKRKPSTPVNLELTGEFLSDLEANSKSSKSGYSTLIGFNRGSKSAKKEQGHREGANTQPKRPIIPEKGEGFSERIRRGIIDFYKEVIKRNIKQIK